jgi:ubiquinone/menaquinone biosynthesis C-methylase UbiE
MYHKPIVFSKGSLPFPRQQENRYYRHRRIMKIQSTETRGRTLDHAAFVYDFLEPILLLGKQATYNLNIISQLALKDSDRVLDLGCGTGVLTKMIADHLSGEAGGCSVGIDAAGKMIQVAKKKRGSDTCRFETAAAEDLPFEAASFDAAVSSLFFHHVDLDLKKKALQEAFRVLRPGGKLVIADMHIPTTRMGALVSHVARWFFLQPEIGENIRGVLPGLMENAGFFPPKQVSTNFGYITTFTTQRP